VSTTGSQNYNKAITLGADTALTGAGVTVTKTVDGSQTLTVNDSGVTVFSDAIGGSAALKGLSVTTAGDFYVSGPINSNGTVSLTSTGGNISGNGTVSAAKIILNAKSIGSLEAPLNVVTKNISIKTPPPPTVSAYLASPTGWPGGDLLNSSGLVRFNGVVVGGDMYNDYLQAVQSGSSSIAMAVNSQQVAKMMQLASFEEFFSIAPKESILTADESLPEGPAFEFLDGRFPDGAPCFLLDEKKR
jgi:hypothetical protein